MRRQPLKVLLVEDSKVLAERLSETINRLDGVWLIAILDTEADAVATLKRESVDVLLLDLHLRQGTGFGVLRSIAAGASVRPRPRIIVLTNYDLPEYKNASLDLGATDFLDKARDFHRLPEVLQACAADRPQRIEVPRTHQVAQI